MLKHDVANCKVEKHAAPQMLWGKTEARHIRGAQVQAIERTRCYLPRISEQTDKEFPRWHKGDDPFHNGTIDRLGFSFSRSNGSTLLRMAGRSGPWEVL